MTATDRDTKWDRRFLFLAAHIATWSKDPSAKVGAVIVGDRRHVLSMGFNGFPMGVEDRPDRLHHRDTKLQFVAHAERNALDLAECSVAGATLYVWPLKICHECAKSVVQKGIRRVVSLDTSSRRWDQSNRLAAEILFEGGVDLSLNTDTDIVSGMDGWFQNCC